MNLLLDACDFLWFIASDPKLSEERRNAIKDPTNAVFLSSASTAEIAIKYSISKLDLPTPPSTYIRDARIRHGILTLPLTEEASFLLADLPMHHKDPFDRILICQAIAHGMTLLTSDPKIHLYDLPLI